MAKRKNSSPKKAKPKMIAQATVLSQYHFTEDMIAQFLPPPTIRPNPHYSGGPPMKTWPEALVQDVAARQDVRAAIMEHEYRQAQRAKSKEAPKLLLKQYDLERMIEYARGMTRRFFLHIGPTNSGKTYQSIQALREAGSGVYLGPLRLLALEMFDTLNKDGYPCSLLTGEEFEDVPFSNLTASTIELCNYQKEYDVAVIDEAQLIADPVRGAHWTKAILCVKAKEVHVCMAPEAKDIVCRILDRAEVQYEIVKHERLAPLVFSGRMKDLSKVEPGDALITFSRKNVLAIAALLEQQGVKASVIYGNLPPVSRREEVRRFTSGESSVIVATDAIGMGVSLPIKRIIFCSSKKFDGTSRRPLTTSEVRQIAGRAGRFGIYDVGEVLAMEDAGYIRQKMTQSTEPIRLLTVPFPGETLSSEHSLPSLLKAWQKLRDEEQDNLFVRADMTDALYLYNHLKSFTANAPKEVVFKLISCPVDVGSDNQVAYWLACCKAILKREEVPMPWFGSETLSDCEQQYKAFDVRHQLLRRVGIEEPHMEEKNFLCSKINGLLASDKNEFLRKCSVCGKLLPITAGYGMCEECYERRARYWEENSFYGCGRRW